MLALSTSVLAMEHDLFADLDPLKARVEQEAINAFCPLSEKEIQENIAEKTLLEVLYPNQVNRASRFTIIRRP
jgi:hypothetical protein